MDKIRVETLIAFVFTVAAVTVLTALNMPIPAAITSALGTLATALLPALLPPRGGQ